MAFHQYNTPQYNVSQYNADAVTWIIALSESIGPTDALGGMSSLKALADTVTSSEAAVKAVNSAVKFEFVFLSDSVTKSISNKGLSESIRLNDWLQIERKGSQWNS